MLSTVVSDANKLINTVHLQLKPQLLDSLCDVLLRKRTISLFTYFHTGNVSLYFVFYYFMQTWNSANIAR